MKELVLLYKKLLTLNLINVPFGLMLFTIIFATNPITGSFIGFVACYFIFENSYRDVYGLLSIVPIKTRKLISCIYCPLIYVNFLGYLLGGVIGMTFLSISPIKLFITWSLVCLLQNLVIPMNFKHGFSSTTSITFTASIFGVGCLSCLFNFMIYSGAFDGVLNGYWFVFLIVGLIAIVFSTLYSYNKSLNLIYGNHQVKING